MVDQMLQKNRRIESKKQMAKTLQKHETLKTIKKYAID